MSRLGQARAIFRALAELAFPSGAAAVLSACVGSVAAPPPVELSIAEPAASVAPPPSSSVTEVAVPAPVQTASAEPTSPTGEVTFAAAPSRAWSGKASNTPGGLTSIWGAGDHVFAAGPGMILRSEDGGLHFTRSAGPKDWPAVWGASVDDVYVAGQHVVRSTDRGRTWVEGGALPGDGYGIWGSGPDDVYVVGGGDHPFVARSTDHGASWVELPTPVSAGWFYGVTGTGPREILVVGKADAAPGGSSPTPSAVLLRSTDSGRHFTRLPPFRSPPNERSESRAACFTRKGLFAASTYALQFTPDLGRTWKEATRVGGEVLTLACRGDDVIVGGRGRTLFVSADGGKTWEGDPLGALWNAASQSSVQAAFVSGSGGAYVGFEALYDRSGRGSLFRRSP